MNICRTKVLPNFQPAHSAMSGTNLVPGDIILYSKTNEKFLDIYDEIADSTKGLFHHAALVIENSAKTFLPTVLHTGPNGAFFWHDDFALPEFDDGVYVIRFRGPVDPAILKDSASKKIDWKYATCWLPFIGLAAWDRRCLNNGSIIFKFFPYTCAKRIIKFFNGRGSYNVCSGLTLNVLAEAIHTKLFQKAPVSLRQMSPNCIWEEATRDPTRFSTFCIRPISYRQLQRKRNQFIFASLLLFTKQFISKTTSFLHALKKTKKP